MRLIRSSEIELSEIQDPEWSARTETYVDPHFVASVKEGLIEPIVVRVIDADTYVLVCGGRRKKAAEEAGLEKIQAQIWEMSDMEAWKMTDQENFQREGVNAMDRAAFIATAMEKFNLTQDQVCVELHLNKSVVSNLLRIYRNPILADKVRNGEHSFQAALVLSSCMPSKEKFPREYRRWFSFVDKTSGLSVGKIKSLISSPPQPTLTKTRKCDGCEAEIKDGNPNRKLELCEKCTERVVKYLSNTPQSS